MDPEDDTDPPFILEFSVPVTPPVDFRSPADVAAVSSEHRRQLSEHPSVELIPGSRHARYPYDPSEDEPVTVIVDRALAERVAAAVADPLPEPAPLGDPPSDVFIHFPDPADEDEWWPILRVAGDRVQDAETGAAWLVDLGRLIDVLRVAGVPDRYLPAARERNDAWPPTDLVAGEALTRRWLERLPGSRPVSYELKEALPDRWIRFHSLPDSKRYADDESEYLEMLRRHRAVLSTLPGPVEVLLITCSWSDGSAVDRRGVHEESMADRSWFWGTVVVEQDENRLRCVDLWVERVDREDARLDLLFRMVADDVTGGVMLVDPELRWVFAPYDGGVDVIAADRRHRDELRAEFSTWLPIGGGLY